MPRAYLSPEQQHRVYDLVERNEIHLALTHLKLVAGHHDDDELRIFATERLGYYEALRKDDTDGDLDGRERRAEESKLRKAILHKVNEYKAAIEPAQTDAAPPDQPDQMAQGSTPSTHFTPPTTGEILKCVDLSKRFPGGFRLPQRIVAEHAPGTSTIVVRFSVDMTICRVMAMVATTGVTGVRDITTSALQFHYPELAQGGEARPA